MAPHLIGKILISGDNVMRLNDDPSQRFFFSYIWIHRLNSGPLRLVLLSYYCVYRIANFCWEKGNREKLRKGQKGGQHEWESSLIFLGEHTQHI